MIKYTAFYILPSWAVWKFSSVISKKELNTLDTSAILCLILGNAIYYNSYVLDFMIMTRCGGEEIKSVIELIKTHDIKNDSL